MATLYFHIPFCKQACHYCDFHFYTSQRWKQRLLESMAREVELRADELPREPISSIYFGGGTPSLLSPEELETFLEKADEVFRLRTDAEVTLEANPDDIEDTCLEAWKKLGFNRISLGVQSFHDHHLTRMNRSHSAETAKKAIECLKRSFSNFSLDLMYGLPKMTLGEWEADLETLLVYEPPHVSAYCLTLEAGTALERMVQKKKYRMPEDDTTSEQFLMTIDRLEKDGYQHYEISNFARPGALAHHNSQYWIGGAYLGIGPSAHSYDGKERKWNILNHRRYMESIESGKTVYNREKLHQYDLFNEYILTGIRTCWGLDREGLTTRAPTDDPGFKETLRMIDHYIAQGQLREKGNRIFLTREGKRYADRIAADLFMA